MEQAKSSRRLLSVREAADYIDRSEAALRKIIFNKQIDVFRARDRSIRITIAELDAFVRGEPAHPDLALSNRVQLKAVPTL